jgi:hypothetical protein
LIGSVRREGLDHVIVWNRRGLRHVLNAYVEYYLHSEHHLPSTRTRRPRGLSLRAPMVASSRFPNPVACTTAISVAPRGTSRTSAWQHRLELPPLAS